MDIQCDTCKRQLHIAVSDLSIDQLKQNYLYLVAHGQPEIDSIAWFCESCLGVHCTVCCFNVASEAKQEILPDPRCPFCSSSKVHIASQKNIEEWDYFRASKKNKGCMSIFAVAGFTILFFCALHYY